MKLENLIMQLDSVDDAIKHWEKYIDDTINDQIERIGLDDDENLDKIKSHFKISMLRLELSIIGISLKANKTAFENILKRQL